MTAGLGRQAGRCHTLIFFDLKRFPDMPEAEPAVTEPLLGSFVFSASPPKETLDIFRFF